MKQKAIYKAIISIAIALAFIMPGAVAFANVEQTINENISSEIGNITDLPTLDDDSDIETPEPLTIDWWPMFHHDAENTGNSSSTAPDTNNVLWEYGTGGTVASAPAVVEGKVYFGSIDGNVYCVDALTGAWIWQYATGDEVWSSPAVVDGKVFVGSGQIASGASNVSCLDALTGAWIWSYTASGGVDSSPVVADGKVFFGSHDNNVYCVDALTGAWIWQYTTGGGVFSSPAVVDGKVYFGSKDLNLYCLNASTGAWIWQYTAGGMVMSSPAVVDGKVYFGASNVPFGTVYCVDALTGAFIWQYMTMGIMVQSSPAVADGKVFVGAFNGNLYCLNALTGAIIWQYATGSAIIPSPAVADGKVYFGSDTNNVYCLDTDGTWIWQHLTAGTVRSSPAVADGKVFIGSSDNFIYCFGPEPSTTIYVDDDADPSWYDGTHVKTIAEGITNATAGYTVYVYNGTYYENVLVNKTVDLIGESKENVIVDGSNAGSVIKVTVNNVNISTFTMTNSNKYCMHLSGSSNSNIINCVSYNNTGFLGAGFRIESNSNNNNIVNCEAYNSNGMFGTGCSIKASSNNILTNCHIHDNDIGMYIERNTIDNTIDNCDVQNNNRYGIWVRGDDITITNCNIHDNVDIGITLYQSDSCHIDNCTFYDHDGGFALFVTQSYYNDITNCTFYDNDDSFSMAYGDENSIADCEFYNNSGTCLFIYIADYIDVTNCVFYDNDDVGLSIYHAENSMLRDNSIYANVYGFSVYGYDLVDFYHDIDTSNTINGKPIYYIIEQNDFELEETNFGYLALVSCTNVTAKNSDVEGIMLVNTTYSMISNISVYRAENGIYLDCSAEYNDIINCDSYDNDYGFYLYDSSNNNISNCNSYNNEYGIYIEESSGNNVTNCNVYNNSDRGIYLRSSSNNNSIHHNNFINNAVENGYDECSNTWDDGSEGNYWDDYNGTDADGDGIGDTPYNISGGDNQDRYPLMGPIPELISPANNSGIEDQTPTFDWTDAWHSWTYTLQVATDPGFADPSIVINQTGLVESEYTPLSDLPFDTYYWRVRTIFLGIITEWSETWSFFIELDLTPPTTPDLNEPADQSTLIITPTIFFDWTDSYDAYGIDYYTLQIATDVDFVNVVFDVTSGDSDYTLTLTTPDEYYWRVQAVDNNGVFSSWSDVWMFTRLADTNPPVIELLYPVGGEYLSGEVTILWDATDDFTPNVDLPITLEYRCGGPWQTLASDEENDGEYLWDTTGYPDGILYKIRISTEDYWGNMGSDESYTTFTVDNTDPLTTAYLDPATPDGDNDWYTSDVQVTLLATDETSGIDYTKYKIDDGAWEIYVVPLTVSDDDEHTVEYYSVDNAGNEETINEVAFNIDQTPPTIELTWDEENSKLVADVDDETSGVAMVEFYVNGVYVGEATTSPYEWEVTNPQQGDTGQAIVYDNAGNDEISEEIDAVSQSQSQSISSSPVSWLFSWLFGLW